MREIGGYMSFEHYDAGEYYPQLLHLNTGRNAIVLCALEKKYKKVWLPKYLCGCVSDALSKYGISFDYYPIDKSLEPAFDYISHYSEAVLIVNYFGQFNNKKLEALQNRFGDIIVDNTQSFFQEAASSINTIYTCRKYFGVSDGAYLHLTGYSKTYDTLETDQSTFRMQHLLGRFEQSASKFYDEYHMAEDSLNHETIKKMSSLTRNILCSIDYNRVIQKRTENFNILHNALKSINQYAAANHGGLYMYPLLLSNGRQIKKQLIQKRIYVPTLWPNVLTDCSADSYEYYLADNMILLPVDQRYDSADMQYMLDILEEILRKGAEV